MRSGLLQESYQEFLQASCANIVNPLLLLILHFLFRLVFQLNWC
jgi:hypothetical protein